MRDAEDCVMLELKGGFSYKAANFLSRWSDSYVAIS